MLAISIKNLKKIYPNLVALKGISLDIKQGEFFALLGPNGAGKSTTISILTGLTNKTEGEVKLFNKDVIKDYREARSFIGLVPQEFNFDIFEKVYNILYYNAGYFSIPSKERKARIEELLKQLDLWKKRTSQAQELSGGMKRKLMIARALIHKPKILILDEPTAGVDVETRQSMYKFFKKLNADGTTILLTTHYLEEAENLCQRIAIINNGEIIKLEDKDKLMKEFGENKKLEEIFIELTRDGAA
jgi:ABC-2 type transport system ATP-binding protein